MADVPADRASTDIFVGKGVLELLSSAMYVNPLSIFREYVQNAVDAIDDAVSAGHLSSSREGRIAITLDQATRRVQLRDNGIGLANQDFAATMLTFGDSSKRGSDARGFRGIGRLAGLGYGQQLIFRSRSVGDAMVMEVTWDCLTIKKLLATDSAGDDLETLVKKAVAVTTLPPDDYPTHFFEVELVKPRRIANDRLMNEVEIASYLGQVAPCPFAPEFSFGGEIANILAPYGRAARVYAIHINDAEIPVYRPYRDTITYAETQTSQVHSLESFEIERSEGGMAAIGWRIHHDYLGAIPPHSCLRGLRARIGNIQVGGERLFVEVFPEDRFCSWSVGEVHVLDARVLPNGRRDAFESSNHLDNIVHHLHPIGMDIARRCRQSSQKRNRLKAFANAAGKINERLEILNQGAVSEQFVHTARDEIHTLLASMQKVLELDLFGEAERKALNSQFNATKTAVPQSGARFGSSFQHLPPQKQRIYREVVDLIYACSADPIAAKVLVDRILERVLPEGS
ncbi:MAG: ATP-binding protein [Rhodobacteraceae bacterium]|nr:ATP-binding protein [Paracoccaceae bacterium]